MAKTSQTPVKQGTSGHIAIDYGKYLRDSISSLPHGIIDKQVPGIGATTLELEDSTRNSIIVFPTRALAATKARRKVEGVKIHYLGSRYHDVVPSNYDDILKDVENGLPVKIAVVADSLIRLYHELKVKLHEYEFFIVLDDVDSFQSESNYRPKLEECFDIYLGFPEKRRCLVSATLEPFSDRQLNSEPKTVIDVANYVKPKMHVIYATKSVVKVAVDKITEKAKEPGKLFIAFNSIEGILKILELLPDELASQSGILCGIESKDRIKKYPTPELIDGLLQNRITFFTSAYFIGLDVLEGKNTVHVIILVDTSLPVSVLSVAKIRQILGRVRYGSTLNTFILNIDDKPHESLNEYDNHLALTKLAYEKVLEAMYTEFGSLGLNDQLEDLERIMLERCVHREVHLLRRKNGKVSVSASNIDHLRQKQKALIRLYTTFRNTIMNLSPHFEITRETVHKELSDYEKSSIKTVEAWLNDQRLANRDFLLENQVTDPKLAVGSTNKIITNIWRAAGTLTNPDKVRAVISSLPIDDAKGINNVLFQVRVFSQAETSEVWGLLNLYFKLQGRYSSEKVYLSIQKIKKALGNDDPFSDCDTPTKAIRKFNLIYDTKTKTNPKTKKRDYLVMKTKREEFCR